MITLININIIRIILYRMKKVIKALSKLLMSDSK